MNKYEFALEETSVVLRKHNIGDGSRVHEIAGDIVDNLVAAGIITSEVPNDLNPNVS